MTPATPETMHAMAFSGVYLLPSAIEADIPVPSDADALLRGLTPEQRDRVLNMALRRLAFQLLYELDQSFAGRAGGAAVPDSGAVQKAVRESLEDVRDIGPVHAAAVAALVSGAYDARTAADADFRELAPEWPTHRLAAVDRALLRLAHFELTSGTTPGKIVVNETVELAKHFSTDKSPAFINALLDRVYKRLNAEETGSGEEPLPLPPAPEAI